MKVERFGSLKKYIERVSGAAKHIEYGFKFISGRGEKGRRGERGESAQRAHERAAARAGARARAPRARARERRRERRPGTDARVARAARAICDINQMPHPAQPHTLQAYIPVTTQIKAVACRQHSQHTSNTATCRCRHATASATHDTGTRTLQVSSRVLRCEGCSTAPHCCYHYATQACRLELRHRPTRPWAAPDAQSSRVRCSSTWRPR